MSPSGHFWSSQVAQNTKDSTGVLRFQTCSRASNTTLADPSGSCQENCKSPRASGDFLVKNGLQDEPCWPLLELKLPKLRPDSTCVFRLLTCSRLSNATLADPSGSYQQNCKSHLASGHFLVKNGLQDEPSSPLLELKLRKIRPDATGVVF